MKRKQSHRTRARLLRGVINIFDQLLVVLEGVLVDLAQERVLGVGHNGDDAHLVVSHVDVEACSRTVPSRSRPVSAANLRQTIGCTE